MNSNLYSSAQGIVPFPKELRQYLKKMYAKFQNVDENTDGYKRNLELQNQKTIDYKQLKRIKNFFDNFKGTSKDPSFNLNGGIEMKNWVENALRQMRERSKFHNQDTKPDSPTISHNDLKAQVGNLVRPSKEHKTAQQKYVEEQTVVESLRRLKEIISTI
jgi:hypothetical protein